MVTYNDKAEGKELQRSAQYWPLQFDSVRVLLDIPYRVAMAMHCEAKIGDTIYGLHISSRVISLFSFWLGIQYSKVEKSDVNSVVR